MEPKDLFNDFEDVDVRVCTGHRTRENQGLPKAEAAIIEHVMARPELHCTRLWGEMTLTQMIDGFLQGDAKRVQALGGIVSPLGLSAMFGLWGSSKGSVPTNEWTLRDFRGGFLGGHGWPVGVPYWDAFEMSMHNCGAERFAAAVGMEAADVSPETLLDIAIDPLREISPRTQTGVANWSLAYNDNGRTPKEFPRPTWVETDFSSGEQEIKGFKRGFDYAVVAVDEPFGETGIKLGLDMGLRAGSTAAAALWHAHLLHSDKERTAQLYRDVYKATTGNDAPDWAVESFVKTTDITTGAAIEMLSWIPRAEGAIFVLPTILEDGMPSEIRGTLHNFEGPDAWVKVDGRWAMMSTVADEQ